MLNTAVPEGGFAPVQEIKGTPVPADTVLTNIEASAKFDLPIMGKQQPQDKPLIFIAGGPTLRDHLDEIRDRVNACFVMTSNNTHDYLVQHGIIPNACLLFDPKQRVVDYVKLVQPSCTYYLATTVTEAVFQKFVDAGARVVKVLVAYGLEGSPDIDLQQKLYPRVSPSNYLIGGTMTPLRAMPFACMAGFSKMEFYGMDSCFAGEVPIIREDEPGYAEALARIGRGYQDSETGVSYVIDEPEDGGYFYAYKKDRIEHIHVVEAGPRRFLSSPGFAYQAKQLVEWVDRLEGKLDVKIHGDSLSSWLVEQHRAAKAERYARIGKRRWTEEYRLLQEQMHEDGNYGVVGAKSFEVVSRMLIGLYAQIRRPVTMIDYGSGPGLLKDALDKALKCADVLNYDPFHPRWREMPEPGMADVVTCMDVMEHVEEECVDNVIDWIADRSRYGAIFKIDLGPAIKNLPDGRNAHITLKSDAWWRQRLSRRFHVTEATKAGSGLLVICAARNAREAIEDERKAA